MPRKGDVDMDERNLTPDAVRMCEERHRDSKDERDPDEFVQMYLRLVCERGSNAVRLTRTDDYRAICYVA